MSTNDDQLLLTLAQAALHFKKAVQAKLEGNPALIEQAAQALTQEEGEELATLELQTALLGAFGNIASQLSNGAAAGSFAREIAGDVIRLGELYARAADKSGAIKVFELASMLPKEAQDHAGYAHEFNRNDAFTLSKLCNLRV